MTATAQTDAVVIGGGSTGAGVARDLAMRGLAVTLLERGNLTDGTTGRMHGLLHSGARYAVSDPPSARDCIEENGILREIAAHCVEDTGGLFAKRPEDPDAYFEEKVTGCRDCDIPTTVLSGDEARDLEPYLHPEVERAIAVPDAAVDPFRLVVANALDAEERGARIETHAEVTGLCRDGDRVTGVEVHYESGPDRRSPPPASAEVIHADHVVNATGAWAGQLAALADLSIDVIPSKGVMVVTNCRQLDTVVNRCLPRGDGDIIVPHETTAILGTTDEVVADPDDYPEERWEVELMIETLSKLVPILAEARTLRSYWGVRPLYDPDRGDTADPTELTRDFALLDHETRDGVAGLTSVVGGKFATYRKMAEVVSDHVCDRLDVSTTCRTASQPLPGSEDPQHLDAAMDAFGLRSPIARRSRQRLGSRAAAVLDVSPNPVLCDCEAVTRAEVRDALTQCAPDLNGVRIRTRASMGNCQGGLCAHRLAAELHPDHEAGVAHEALDELYQERWKGQRHALWGEQLSQVMLTHALHATTMNRDRDPARSGETIEYAAFDGGGNDGNPE